MTKRIFITKPDAEVAEIRSALEQIGKELIAYSFLRFDPVPFLMDREDFPIIFFSSKRAVDFYLREHSIGPKQLVACIGESTANYILSHSITPSFIGEEAGNPLNVGKQLKEWAAGRRIAFPISSRSKHTITTLFTPEQIHAFVCYKTELVSGIIPECSEYIFTSPSNVDGFFIENSLPPSCKIIAWGKTTESYLLAKDIRVTSTLIEASKNELIRYLLNEQA